MSTKLSGVVKPYTGNGRRLGYPTANIEVPAETDEGIFIGYVRLEGSELPALIFVGNPVTLGDPVKRAEGYILDFADRDLYGEQVTFTLVKKLRDNEKYEGEAKLIEQMKQDEVDARKYFKENK